jgi:VAD1 Analog of StAR-related lipid transfer domain/PH domain
VFAGYASRELRIQTEVTKGFTGLSKEMKKVLAWNDEMTASAKLLQDQLYATKTKLEKEISERIEPKRDLTIYQPYTQEKSKGFRLGRSSVESDDPNRKRNYSVSSSGKPAKQGWLFNRVAGGKPAKWVRRWFFVKGGTFGWLQNSSRTAAVEESERVGVLLCNVRLAPSEDRRFCFEVMTKSVNYMLQAETDGDLADWIQVFELAKNAVLADEKEHHPQAFSIMTPSHPEFAIPPVDEHDRHGNGGASTLTTPQPVTPRASFDVVTTTGGGGSMQTSRSIVQKLEIRLKDRPKAPVRPAAGGIASLVAASQSAIAGQHVPVQHLQINVPRPLDIFTDPISGSNIAPSTLALPPISTQMSTRAVQARSRSASTSSNAPSGIMANYWGSMHWGLVSVNEVNEAASGADSTNQAQGSADTYFEKSQKTSPSHHPAGSDIENVSRSSISHRRSYSKSTSSVEFIPIRYPADYPLELRKQDGQFRTLFPASRQDEFVLLVCRVCWQPVEGQRLWGRMYATNSGLHFFAHAQGIVCVQSVPFSDIINISHHVGISSDNIVIERDNLDPIDAKVYLDSANLLTRRIDVLFRNSLSDLPMDTQEILHQIRQMEEEQNTDEDEKARKHADRDEDDLEITRAAEGLYADEAAAHGLPSQLLRRSGDSVRVVFPSEPIICKCKNHLATRFAESIFHIPAKSLFHLMFGDHTPIWKKLYRGRRVGDIEIGPWKTSNKSLVREYKYTITFTDAISSILCSCDPSNGRRTYGKSHHGISNHY